MSFKLLAQLRKALPALRKPSYTASHSAVLVSIADHLNDKDGYAFPGMELIAAECFIGKRQARKVVAQLEADGLLEVIHFPRRFNHYKVHIKNSAGTDKPLNSSLTEAGLSNVQKVTEAPHPVAEARLTYNSNLLLKSIGDAPSNLLIERAILAQDHLLSEEKTTGQSPVKTSELIAPCEDVKEIHSLLMKKIGAKDQKPSKKDLELLRRAIDQFGVGELQMIIKWAFKRKDPFWSKGLKGADRPCSYLSRCLHTMKSQFEAKEGQKDAWAVKRELDRVQPAAETAEVEGDNYAQGSNGAGSDDDGDFDGFDVPDDDLDV